MRLDIGYLFKKYKINYNNKEQEIFIFKDVAIGFTFFYHNNKIFHVISEDSPNIYASVLTENGNECEDIIIIEDLDRISKEVNYVVDYSKIRAKMLEKMKKYYIRYDNKTLQSVVDQNLIKTIEKKLANKIVASDVEASKVSTSILDMYHSIKKTIISQDEQIMTILTSLYKNQTVVNSDLDLDLISKLKENILVFGSTGTGKTEILKQIAKLYNVPIVIADATQLSETGYQGRNVTDMLEDLYIATNKNINLAQRGILVIDEFDKLAEKKEDHQTHVSRLGVQRSLLKLLDGSDFYLKDGICFNTSKLSVVALGAFTGILENNIKKKQIGFGTSVNEDDSMYCDYKNVTMEDFINFGLMSEVIGRFSKLVPMNTLKREDIKRILIESDSSPLNTHKELFRIMNIEFDYSDEFIDWLAEKAVKLQSGARCLKTVFDECISSAMFDIFAGQYSKLSLVKPDSSEEEKPYVLTK